MHAIQRFFVLFIMFFLSFSDFCCLFIVYCLFHGILCDSQHAETNSIIINSDYALTQACLFGNLIISTGYGLLTKVELKDSRTGSQWISGTNEPGFSDFWIITYAANGNNELTLPFSIRLTDSSGLEDNTSGVTIAGTNIITSLTGEESFDFGTNFVYYLDSAGGDTLLILPEDVPIVQQVIQYLNLLIIQLMLLYTHLQHNAQQVHLPHLQHPQLRRLVLLVIQHQHL